jgi:hypothetical protein
MDGGSTNGARFPRLQCRCSGPLEFLPQDLYSIALVLECISRVVRAAATWLLKAGHHMLLVPGSSVPCICSKGPYGDLLQVLMPVPALLWLHLHRI